MMGRREVITMVGGGAVCSVVWPIAARTQQSAVPVVGWLGSGSREDTQHLVTAFWRGMNEQGYVEGRNVTSEYRWADGRYDRLAALAADLVRRRVKVIVAAFASPTALVAKAATNTIPIIFLIGADPVAAGLVASLNRPGGNLTGITATASEVAPKRLTLLRDLAPSADTIAVLLNPENGSNVRTYTTQDGRFLSAARTLGIQIEIVKVSKDDDIEPAIDWIASRNIRALYIAADSLFINRRDQLAELSMKRRIAASAEMREFVEAGGLTSYGTDLKDHLRLGGVYVARILNGDKPAELPVMQATKFEFVINLKTAKALGLDVPDKLLALADEVIE
jgi:ABC-type uncharacterized transport system substrate-binding protein